MQAMLITFSLQNLNSTVLPLGIQDHSASWSVTCNWNLLKYEAGLCGCFCRTNCCVFFHITVYTCIPVQ